MPFDEIGDGPVALQLLKWSQLHIEIDLSQFLEAFISPTKELLLLLSSEHDALLLPLAAGNEADVGNLSSEERGRSSASTFPSYKRESPWDRFPAVHNVKSLAWGRFGDTYDHHEGFSFSEILFVTNGQEITVHAFCTPRKNSEIFNPQYDNDATCGNCVAWGPVICRQSEGQCISNSLEHESICSSHGCFNSGCTLHSDHESDYINMYNHSFAKKWLQSRFIELDAGVSDGHFLARFPKKRLPSCCSAVVSFNIYHLSLKFLDFLSNGTISKGERRQTSIASANLQSYVAFDVPVTRKSMSSDGDDNDIPYKCHKIFSSGSHKKIGMVLGSVENGKSVNDDTARNTSRSFIIVLSVCPWGIEWLYATDIQRLSLNLNMEEAWSDFQLSDDFLLFLHTSGLIFVMSADDGNPVSQFHVQDSSGFSSIHSTHCFEPEHGMINDPSSLTGMSDVTHRSGKTKIVFRRLVVSSSSKLIAVVDQYGTVYVLYMSEHLPKCNISSVPIPSCHDYFSGIQSGWEVPGYDVGNQKALVGSSMLEATYTLRSKATMGGYRKKTEHNAGALGNGFHCSCHHGRCTCTPLRRVLLPTEGCTGYDPISVSAFGVTQFVTCANKFEGSKVVHTCLHVSSVLDERDLGVGHSSLLYGIRESSFSGKVIACCFQECMYLVSQDGLFVVLPLLLLSPNVFPTKTRSGFKSESAHRHYDLEYSLSMEKSNSFWTPWQVEIIDRAILYEGPEQADSICLKNGWDLKLSRVRRMQLALHHLNCKEIERSLEMLADVTMAEDGILMLLFTAVYQIFCLRGADTDLSLVARCLPIAACFATKMIRKYCSTVSEEDTVACVDKKNNTNCERLREMAFFLEIIRNFQCRMPTTGRAPTNTEGDNIPVMVDANLVQEVSPPEEHLGRGSQGVLYATKGRDGDMAVLLPKLECESSGLELAPVVCSLGPGGEAFGSQLGKSDSLENPKDMISRWVADDVDLRSIVKDALMTDRLPLAVLQLHLRNLKEITTEEDSNDHFSIVRDIGRSVAYDLFLKGESELAIGTLQRLGEDVETSLRQLLFGTVRRSVRLQVSKEMERFGFLRSPENETLEKLSLVERLYSSNSFWRTYMNRKKSIDASSISTPETEPPSIQLHRGGSITCGEIDGVVTEPWKSTFRDHEVATEIEDTVSNGYWSCAAVWSDSWDQITIDRIVLDSHSPVGVNVSWESELVYHISHDDWEEVDKLLNAIPAASVSEGCLKINLEKSHSINTVISADTSMDDTNLICSSEDIEPVYMDIPNVKTLRLPVYNRCSSWMRNLVERKLAKDGIFIRDYWESIDDILPLIVESGLLSMDYMGSFCTQPEQTLQFPTRANLIDTKEISEDPCMNTLHKLFACYCVRYNLPSLMDLYLDHHKLALDNNSVCSLLEAVGECQWARWLLLSRVKGCEYDASFANARSILAKRMDQQVNLNVMEMNEIVQTVDDMAEGGGEFAAVATLVYAPQPMQNCLCSGGVKRNYSGSFQCTLENLKHGLQRFPTLWRALVAACFEQDIYGHPLNPGGNAHCKSAFSDYLIWRDSIFTTVGGDTSLIQMLPSWFSKATRRLIKIFVQGPLAWRSIADDTSSGGALPHRTNPPFIDNHESAGFNPISWEAATQRSMEELYATLQENTSGIEHHLHCGRALAAFKYLLGLRAFELKSGHSRHGAIGGSSLAQTNIQSDVQTLLGSLTQKERSMISSVMRLAIMHFEDSALVASCAFLLELCGVSANMIRLDVAVLKRISSYFKTMEAKSHLEHTSSRGSAFHAMPLEGDICLTLSRALADDYIRLEKLNYNEQNETPRFEALNRPSRNIMNLLLLLEMASLPSVDDGRTAGSWLMSGVGDGLELREKQRAASQHWGLVMTFCQMHHLPLSTKYLSVLAKDNDWVGFLTEAQMSRIPMESIIREVQEFSDPRLRVHVLTVLRNIHFERKKLSSASSSSTDRLHVSISGGNHSTSIELFGLIAECEKQKCPGEALLVKAKDLHWSLLAMVASCFPDVSALSCLTVWLEISAARETTSIKVNDISSQIAANVGAAVKATNALLACNRSVQFHYNRKKTKRRRQLNNLDTGIASFDVSDISSSTQTTSLKITTNGGQGKSMNAQCRNSNHDEEGLSHLSNMIAVLCEQHLFIPLLRAFEMFLPSCSLLPFLRSLQAFSQMRLTEASAHLASFSARIKEGQLLINTNREEPIKTTWISSTAVKAADAMLATCPSIYEKRRLLLLLASAEFGDGGSASGYFRRLYWKINLAEPLFCKDGDVLFDSENLDDASLLEALEKSGHWDQARNWAKQLESSTAPLRLSAHHVTEMQAESMVAEWKEFLWDVPEERAAIWNHCQTLFLRHSFPPLQAGKFFLKHAEYIEKDVPARELCEILLLSLQWLSGTITQSILVYPLHLLREIETRVWLLAVESEAQYETERSLTMPISFQSQVGGNGTSIVEQTANVISKMDIHINSMMIRTSDKNLTREGAQPSRSLQGLDGSGGANARFRRKTRNYQILRRTSVDPLYQNYDTDDYPGKSQTLSSDSDMASMSIQEENTKTEPAFSGWEERLRPAEVERAILSLLEFGQIHAAKQLQQKLSPAMVPSELVIVDLSLRIASMSSDSSNEISTSLLDADCLSVLDSYGINYSSNFIDTLQVLESLGIRCREGCGRGLCKRIYAVYKSAKVLQVPFSEAFDKKPTELLQLLSLKAQDSLEEAKLLVQSHVIPSSVIARILAESFLKGLLAAHRGGYMESQKEEGPAPLLWRFSDFLKWAELCPSESEIGHALMRLVITGQEIPHACEVELLILSHLFYKSSSCLDGVDVLVTLAANRVDSYVIEGDFSCLARLVTGVSNFHALNFILGILIENGQLDLLLQKYSSADAATGTAVSVRGFRMAVLTALKQFNPHDLDAIATVYNHFDMKHETALLLESRSKLCLQQWSLQRHKDHLNVDLLESMHYLIQAAEVYATIDAGQKTHQACAHASLISLQMRVPDLQWLALSATNARRLLVYQSRFQEALIVAEAYGLNQPSEWVLVLWDLMLRPDLIEQFVAEFVCVLPLHPSMLLELAKFCRAEVAARGDQFHFSSWLSSGGTSAERVRHLGRSFRSLLKRTRDLRLRMQLATTATGLNDIIHSCNKVLDKVPDCAGPLILRKGHGGAYLPLM